MSFTRELWTAMTPIYEAILRHPFLTGLTDGTLPRAAFRFYAVQDALCLREFARALDSWVAYLEEIGATAVIYVAWTRSSSTAPAAPAVSTPAPQATPTNFLKRPLDRTHKVLDQVRQERDRNSF